MLNKIFLFFGLINVAFAKPSIDVPLDEYCINSTKENEIKLNAMVKEIVDFLGHLSVRYEEFDIRALNFKIDKHYDDEDEKDTVLDITVNYCNNNEENKEPNIEFNGSTGNTDDEEITQIDINLRPSVLFLELPENAEKLFNYLEKKRGSRPFFMYINGYKQLILP